MSATVRQLVRAQWATLSRRPLTWVSAIVFVAYLVMVLGSFALLLLVPDSELLGADVILQPMRVGGLPYIAQLGAGIAAILVVVYGASMVGHEFSRGTVRTLLQSGVQRGPLAMAMLIVLFAVCVVLALVGVVVALLSGWAFSAAAGEDLVRFQGIGHAAMTIVSLFLRLTVQFTVWGVLAFAAALLTRSLLAGIGGVLALQIVGSIVAGILAATGAVGEWIVRILLPNTAVDRIVLPRVLDFSVVDWIWIPLVLLAWLGLPTWWAVHRFRRMDVLAATHKA